MISCWREKELQQKYFPHFQALPGGTSGSAALKVLGLHGFSPIICSSYAHSHANEEEEE